MDAFSGVPESGAPDHIRELSTAIIDAGGSVMTALDELTVELAAVSESLQALTELVGDAMYRPSRFRRVRGFLRRCSPQAGEDRVVPVHLHPPSTP